MSFLEILLQIGTVFLGAFLAFGLENFRERRQLRAWADDYLSRIREDLFTEAGANSIERSETVLRDYAAFIAFEKDYVPTEAEWDSLMNFVIDLHADYRTLLENTAVRVLPAELVKALSELNQSRRADEIMTNLCSAAWQQYAVPLRLKQTPVTDEERRGLEYVQKLFEVRVMYTKERRELEKRVLELLDQHNLGR